MVAFKKLYTRFSTECTSILALFERPLPPRPADAKLCQAIHQKNRELCVIQIHDAWARFCRELIVQSAACRPVSLGGSVIPLAPGVTHRNDVMARLLATYPKKTKKPPYWEPRWGD